LDDSHADSLSDLSADLMILNHICTQEQLETGVEMTPIAALGT
jgi:hypothetical protein